MLKQQHLRALTFQRLVLDGGAGVGRPGRTELIVVVDPDAPNGAGGPSVDWGIPVELPGLGAGRDVRRRRCARGRGPQRCRAARAGRARSRSHHPVGEPGPTASAAGAVCDVRSAGLLRCGTSALQAPPCDLVASWRPHRSRQLCCRCAPTTTPRSTTTAGTSRWAANRELTITFPDGTIHNTGPPNGEQRDDARCRFHNGPQGWVAIGCDDRSACQLSGIESTASRSSIACRAVSTLIVVIPIALAGLRLMPRSSRNTTCSGATSAAAHASS